MSKKILVLAFVVFSVSGICFFSGYFIGSGDRELPPDVIDEIADYKRNVNDLADALRIEREKNLRLADEIAGIRSDQEKARAANQRLIDEVGELVSDISRTESGNIRDARLIEYEARQVVEIVRLVIQRIREFEAGK